MTETIPYPPLCEGEHNQLCQPLCQARNETMTTLRATGRGLQPFSQFPSSRKDGFLMEPSLLLWRVVTVVVRNRRKEKKMTSKYTMELDVDNYQDNLMDVMGHDDEMLANSEAYDLCRPHHTHEVSRYLSSDDISF